MPEDPSKRGAFGEDELETGATGELRLLCPSPKSWLPRRPKTLTSATYPGTAVEWAGGLFEVTEAEPLPGGGIRYRLEPWDDAHAIRRLENYDASTESAREAEQVDRRQDLRKLRLSILLAPLAGLLPGDVQKSMANEFGAPALGMTFSSAVPLFMIGGLGLWQILRGMVGLDNALGILAPPPAVALYLFFESVVRIGSVVAAGEPMGSLPVVVAYAAWREGRAPGRDAPGPVCPLPEPERKAQDHFRMLEPMLSLLPADEQQRIARRFPFEPIRWGKITAGILLVFGGGNALMSLLEILFVGFRWAAAAWVLGGGLLAAEQIRRWRRLRGGEPAGSVLGGLVRPFAKPLLAPREAGG